MTDTVSTRNQLPETRSRSLWATAFLRLRRNKAAMASAVVLVVYVLAGIFGPMIAPHHYATVYSEYVKVPASLEPYPREESILPAAEDAIARQPEAAGTLSRTLFVGLAMIETMAIYCLVIALLLLFANPYTV